MKTVGIIAEYNPFHKGHQYHLHKAKELTGADAAIVLMSGNFVQRGTPAIIEKHIRANTALKNGADLILELPAVFSTGSAEFFAYGAIYLLQKSGIADTLCFGSEGADIPALSKIADILLREPPAFSAALSACLKSGCSFPAARSYALSELLPDTKEIISTPNHILGIEYLKAIKKLNSSIVPYAIPRINADYHAADYDSRLYSASAFRSLLHTNQDPENFIAELCRLDGAYNDYSPQIVPLIRQDFSSIFGEKILSAAMNNTLTKYADISHDLANAIQKNILSYTDIEDFINILKSKNYTHTRISRCLTHILLNISGSLTDRIFSEGLSYVRVLGCSEKGVGLLGKISKNLTVLTKISSWQDILSAPLDREVFSSNLYADHLYHMTAIKKAGRILPNEYQYRLLTS